MVISNLIKEHRLVKLLFRMRNSLFIESEANYKKGFNDCLYSVLRYCSELPNNQNLEVYNLRAKMIVLEEQLEEANNKKVSVTEAKRYRKELGMNVHALMVKGKHEDVMEILKHWINLNNKDEF